MMLTYSVLEGFKRLPKPFNAEPRVYLGIPFTRYNKLRLVTRHPLPPSHPFPAHGGG